MNDPHRRPSRTNPRRWRRAALPALALALLGTSAAGAAGTVEPRLTYRPELPALHPNLARGFELDRSFDSDGFSWINLFNGNLFLGLPIGLRYPLSDAFGYQLMLTYNSKVWDYEPVAGKAESRPLAWSNAGLGFDLSLGRLLAPLSPGNPTGQWLYGGFDGSPHLLYSTLHHDVAEPDDPDDDRLYSRDGAYLRLRRISASERRVERPDGVVGVFQLQGSEWRLVRQFRSGDEGSDLAVAYAPDGSQWTLSDAHGRVHVVTFRDDPSGAYPRLVDTVELAAFGGARALYTFDYAWTSVPRACDDRRGGEVTVPLLTAITDPAGQTRAFSYYGTGDCATGGRLHRAQWAAGGHWQWRYRAYDFPPIDCSGGTTAPYFLSETGVESRSLVLPDGTIEGTWDYDPALTDPGSQCGAWRFENTVTAPDGDRTVHHFSVANALSATGSPADYALPLTRETTDPTGTRYLSTQTHDCAAGGGSCTLLRSTYVAWAQDRYCTGLTGECTDTNRRRYAERTLFHDDLDGAGAPRFLDVTHNDFDGLGHYRIETRTNNFGRAEFFQVTTGYNSANGSYPGSFTMPAGGAPWHLGRYAHRRLNDGLDTSRRDACFDAHGRLLRERWRNGDGQATTAHDVVKTYAWEGWNRVEEADYGGEVQALPTGTSLCTIKLPDAAQYLVRRTYQAGTLGTEQDVDPVGGKALPFARLDRDVDADTGLVATRRDVAGIATELEYDLLGRPTWERPEGGQGAWIEHAYVPPTGGSGWWEGPRTVAYRRPNGGGSPLVKEVLWHDVFGQLAAIDQTLPNGTKSRRRYLYDALGREVAVSVRHDPDAGGTLRWHQTLDFDPFDRPRRLRPPEGPDHDEVIAYTGIREERRTLDAGRWYSPGLCMESPVTYVTTYDGNGRVWKEVEDRPQPVPGLLVERERRYDLAGRLTFTSALETVGGTLSSSWSSQIWDERGFLLEVRGFDSFGQQSMRLEYEEHDARGNPRLRTRSGYGTPAGGISVRTTYDAAGRTVSIADAADPAKLWKTFVYGDDNAPGDARRGKLVSARRFNYPSTAGTFAVEHAYVYGGLGGRVSEDTLTIERTIGTPFLRRYRTEVEYDELGWIQTLHYPRCLACPAGEPALARTLTADRGGDLVTAVHGTLDGAPESWLAGVTYGVSGLPATVEHGNGVSEIFAPDPHGWDRPSAIQVQGAHVEEESGTIVYDGEGQLCGTGANSNVPVRTEEEPTPPWEIPCFDAVTVDPFERLTDEIRDPQCEAGAPPPVRLYDAADGLVGFIDTRARKKVLIGGQWQWINDTDRWTRTWTVPGLDGRTLRQVEEGYVDNAWRSTTDVVYEFDREIARQRREVTSNGVTIVTTRHRHPIGRSTDPYGLPRVTD